MASMKELIERQKSFKDQSEEVESQMSAMVWRVLTIFRKQDFGWTKPNYHSGSPNHELVGNHLWPQSFDSFEIEDGDIMASGMYSGAMSYYEPETVRFPAAWLELDDDTLVDAIHAAWRAHVDGIEAVKAADAEAVRLAREFRDHEEYERLKKKFG